MYTNWNGDPLPIKSAKWLGKETSRVWDVKHIPTKQVVKNSKEYVTLLAVRC